MERHRWYRRYLPEQRRTGMAPAAQIDPLGTMTQ